MPEGYFFIFIKGAALCVISSERVSVLKGCSRPIKRHYETDRASQFTGLQDLLTVTETSTIVPFVSTQGMYSYVEYIISCHFIVRVTNSKTQIFCKSACTTNYLHEELPLLSN